MLGIILRGIGRAQLVLAALALALLLCEPSARRYGDRIQVALPLIAWGCAALNRNGAEFFARFVGMMTVLHGTKQGLGDAPINRRPSGGTEGFPSGHTAAAAFGASALAHDCIAASPGAKAVVVIAAAYVGGSRIEAGVHNIWQVLAGGLLGWGADRVLRRDQRLRARVAAQARLLRGQALLGVLRLRAVSGRALVASRRGLGAALAMAVALWAGTARAEMELSLYGGMQTAPHSTIRHSTLGDEFVKWDGKSFAMPPYYGLRATWWPNERFGYGLEFNHAKIAAADPLSHGYQRLEFTDGLNLVTLNIWRRWQGGRFTPYVGAGLGLAVPHVEVQPVGQALTYGYQVTGPALQLVAGVAMPLDGNWALFGEWKGTWSRHKADLDSGGTLSTDIITNALNIGVTWRF